MLIDFTLENWLSFRDEATLSMVPTNIRKFNWTLPTFSNVPKKLLPIAVIYGANASGKTNFVEGLSFLRDFVVEGREEGKPTLVIPYKLDPEISNNPTKFSITFRTEGSIYKYNIDIDEKYVVYESLVLKNKKSEIVLFERIKGEGIKFDKSEDKDRNHFVYEGTQDNVAFLTSAFKQKVSFVVPVYEWFRSKLIVIGTTSHYRADEIFDNKSSIQLELAKYLSKYDTGICGIQSETVKIPESNDDNFSDTEDFSFIASYTGDRIRVFKDDSGKNLSILNAVHKNIHGDNVYFKLRYESDGTRRLLDLLPALILCKLYPEKERVFVIDEIDRSLHSHLVYKMITEYLEACSAQTRFQCIVTTHNTNLIDQTILRRDELWITDKNNSCSSLYSISDYGGIDNHTHLKKLYDEGRFGGIPRIINYRLAYKKIRELKNDM